jgi:hypothetical protein
MKTLLAEFVSALDAETALIERDSREQVYELLAGQRDEKSTGALYVFVLADVLRLPEDAAGTLRVGSSDVRAMVVAQEGNRIWLLLESVEQLPPYLPSARLVLNETELLQRLKERIEALRSAPDLGLAPKVFGKEPASIGAGDLPASIADRVLSDRTKKAIEQCIGSEVTFLWGPPGTGKTFSIAALVATLASLGETVLVTSHTHAAVEQALWALIQPPDDKGMDGPLHDSQLVADGRILKVGPLRSEKIPPCVHLDSRLADRAEQREADIAMLVQEQGEIAQRRELLSGQLVPWQALADAEAAHERAVYRHDEAVVALRQAAVAVEAANTRTRECEAALMKATKSFFLGRARRVAKARAGLDAACESLLRAEAAAGRAEAARIRERSALNNASERLRKIRSETEGLAEPLNLEEEIGALNDRWQGLTAEIRALREVNEDDADALLENAAALFITLTKLYMDRTKISELKWDTVVIDEASMAMPPLVAYAASRARKRVVIVGDMYQLPPVVHSPEDGAGRLLGQDIFLLRHITGAIDKGEDVPQLAMLRVQRRMHPAIAAVAKELIAGYRDLWDAPETMTRSVPPFVSALGTNSPLIIVDIADLNPWCGKMPGTLSRFNFLSGQVAVELAALYAAELPEPSPRNPPQIGIVNPYAAQRRYLTQLVRTPGLERWVTAGTVHSFQGNECDVIIFDSVLGEPHWTARLTNPHQLEQVRRDLNVAVTRAKHQFVFVGDSHWLKKNAKPGSAYGKLWTHLTKAATPLNALTLLGEGFRTRVAQASSKAQGWAIGGLPESVTLLNETDFYPAFAADLASAQRRVILYTPFIGKTRWPMVEPHIVALRERGREVYLLHKPLTDRDWIYGDPEFGRKVFESLESVGTRLIPVSGVHAKTIVIDSHIVYEGSLNWASQTSSYEHMWRFVSKDMALLVERMMQLEPLVEAYGPEDGPAAHCPNCGGRLMVINQAQQTPNDGYPVKLGCYSYSESKVDCVGYLRRVDGRAPFKAPPACAKGSTMALRRAKSGRPWAWHCGHKTCKPIRWARGDCEA